MLGASLRHRGVELLRRVEDLDGAAAKGSTAGLPLLHPWANRLAGPAYRAAGRSAKFDLASPLLHTDEHGLPIHGVPWARLAWEVLAATPDVLQARLDWRRPDLLAVFPYPHRLELVVTIRPDGLTMETTLAAGAEGPVPASFGFHPYLGLPDLPRARWRLELPAMRRLTLDGRGIPTGEETPVPGFQAELGEASFDHGFALLDEGSVFVLSGPGLRLSVEMLGGYTHAQVFAPSGKDLVALEPMTAPANALVSGRGLRVVEPGSRLQAAFRIGVVEI
jgi:aldose 1-epimerase